MENDARITLRLPESLIEKAQAEARQEDRTMSWVVRKALEERYREEVSSEGTAATD